MIFCAMSCHVTSLTPDFLLTIDSKLGRPPFRSEVMREHHFTCLDRFFFEGVRGWTSIRAWSKQGGLTFIKGGVYMIAALSSRSKHTNKSNQDTRKTPTMF